MQEINMLKYQEQLKKGRLSRVLKENGKARVALAAACAGMPGLIMTNNEFLHAFLVILTISELRYITTEVKKQIIPEQELIANQLRNSSTYHECVREYNQYIKEVAKLIRNLGFKSSKDVVTYLQLLLDTGHFSKYMNHRYKKFNYENEYITELCGARVMTGKSVCRHMSTFFADVLNQLGYTAANIQVNTTEKDPIKVATNEHRIPNHAIVGVMDQGEKFMYDPTSGLFTTPPKGISFEEPESVLISEYVAPKDNKRYVIIDPKSKILNPQREKQLSILNTARSMTITPGEAEYLRNKAEIIYRGNAHNQYEFFTSQEERRAKIAELYSDLCPHSDSKIKKWTIQK